MITGFPKKDIMSLPQYGSEMKYIVQMAKKVDDDSLRLLICKKHKTNDFLMILPKNKSHLWRMKDNQLIILKTGK